MEDVIILIVVFVQHHFAGNVNKISAITEKINANSFKK